MGLPQPGRVLVAEDELAARVAELGRAIARDYARANPVLVGVLQGAFLFVADLIRAAPDRPHRRLRARLELRRGHDVLGHGAARRRPDVSTSRTATSSSSTTSSTPGLTLACLKRTLEARRPRSVRACVLLDKVEPAAGRRRDRLRRLHDPQRVRGGLRLRLRRALPQPAPRRRARRASDAPLASMARRCYNAGRHESGLQEPRPLDGDRPHRHPPVHRLPGRAAGRPGAAQLLRVPQGRRAGPGRVGRHPRQPRDLHAQGLRRRPSGRTSSTTRTS